MTGLSYIRAFCAGAFMLITTMGAAMAADLENTLYLETKDGRIVIELRPDLAPKHVARIKELVREKFYDGIVFHRVIEGFMVQTGDPEGNVRVVRARICRREFTSEKHVRGTVSMARSASPSSADSQFFIMLGDSPHLDNKYSIWGQVTSGMEIVDMIKKGDSSRNGSVSDPDKIVTFRVAADVDK